jgi:hypothetical protein
MIRSLMYVLALGLAVFFGDKVFRNLIKNV